MSENSEASEASRAFYRRRASTVTSGRLLTIYMIGGFFLALILIVASLFAKEIAFVLFPGGYPERFYAELRLVIIAAAFASLIVSFSSLTLNYLRTGTLSIIKAADGVATEDSASSSTEKEEIIVNRSSEDSPKTPSELTIQLADELQLRLDAEIVAQNGKANINLIFGTGAALVAFSVLVLSVFLPPHDADDRIFAAVFASRVGTSITASIFAFFFLSTYRRNLNEIRYFHNEMTNIESKLLAFRMYLERPLADEKAGDAAYASILQSFITTERNFLLKKGETTTDISHREIDLREQTTWMATLATLQNSGQMRLDAKERRGRNPLSPKTLSKKVSS